MTRCSRRVTPVAALALALALGAAGCGKDHDDGGDDDDGCGVGCDAAPMPDAPSPPDAAAPVDSTSPGQFATALGELCGIGFDHVDQQIWVYACGGATIEGFDEAGATAGSLTRPGESANDVDVEFLRGATTVGETAAPDGAMLFIDGETDAAEVHLPEIADAPPLVAAFGDGHVVGGAHHPGRGSLFLVQDQVAGTDPNTVAEIDPATGAVRGSFSLAPDFEVSYGDLEVCPSSGHLFVVSSIQVDVAELTPAGELIARHPLPEGVGDLSGIAFGREADQAWVASRDGSVHELAGLPCPVAAP